MCFQVLSLMPMRLTYSPAGPGAGSPTVTGSAPGLVTPGRDGPGPRDRATVAALLTVAVALSH